MIIFSSIKQTERTLTDVICANTKTVSRGKSRVKSVGGIAWTCMREIRSGTEKGEAMSLILKGIDIPNSGQIEIIIRPHGKVFSKTRGISAEAIQIPKGHGDIKDVSEAIKGWCEGCAFKDTEECADCKDKEMWKYAPTILEAEEEDGNRND